jgi:lambda family phage portal protein
MKTNWLDRAISWVAPQMGLRRERARAIAETMLSYEGVRSARRQGGWNTSGSSGNSEIGTGLVKLRSNARDMCRNNAYARKAKREWAKRVVGTGITPRPITGNDALNKVIAGYWNKFARECCSDHRINFYAAEKLIVQSCYESGEVLVRLWNRLPSDGLAVPMQIQILEADYLDETRIRADATGYIIQGVEYDLIGRIKGYWLFGNHPGEVTQTSLRGSMASKFVPVEQVLHHAEVDRPGDVRAVTRFAAVIAKLRDLDEVADAKIMRMKVEACLVGIVTQAEGADGPTLGGVIKDTDGKNVENLSPGMLAYGPPGTDITFTNPTAAGDYSAYKETELREVSVGLDIPYIVLDDNMRAVNYSSYRSGLLSFRDAIEEYRWNWLIPQVLDPIYAKFIDTLNLMGAIPEPITTVEWDPPPFDLLDRAAEAEADRLELQIGKKSWPQLIGSIGNDPDEQIKQISDWKQPLEDAGVTFAGSTSESMSTADANTQGENSNAKPTPNE